MRVDIRKQGGYATSGISSSGGTVNGKLILSRHPSDATEAATKGYIDNLLSNLNANSFIQGALSQNRLPAFNGDVTNAEGSNIFSLYPTGVTPGKYTKVRVNTKGLVISGTSLGTTDIPEISWNKIISGKPNTLAGYGITDAISINDSITMSGPLNLAADPTSDNHLVTKRYIDMIASNSSGYRTGDIIRRPSSVTPDGFYRANGGQVDKDTNSSLYSVIGDKYTNYTTPGSGQPWQQQYQINDKQSSVLGTWSLGTALPVPMYLNKAIVTKNRIYLLAGIVNGVISTAVYTSVINSDGSLGAWTSTTALPVAMYGYSIIVVKNRIYLFGGHNGSAALSTIYTTTINSDGTLGTWAITTPLPLILNGSLAVMIKNSVYLIGGDNGTTIKSTIYRASIYSDGSLGVWENIGSLVSPLSTSLSIVTKNRIYLVGGYNGVSYNGNIYTALINSDGTFGTWTSAGSLPGVLTATQVIVTKNRVHLLGGNTNGLLTGNVSTVYTAPINSDGTLGTWETGSPINTACDWSQAIITSSRVYLLGGLGTTANLSTVQYTTIVGGKNDYSEYYQEDATNYMMPGSGRPWEQQYQINETQSTDITGWTTATALPTILCSSQYIVTKNRVYLIGGSNGSISLNTVYVAQINNDGSLGAWSTGTPLPVAITNSSAILTKNRVYLLGGLNNGVSSTAVYSAQINSDGTLGTWSIISNLPIAINATNAIITKNRIYLIAGHGTKLIYSSQVNSDGTLDAWVNAGELPVALHLGSVIVTKNRIYYIGGATTVTAQSTVYTATINSEGLIGAWSTSTALPGNIYNAITFVTKNTVYVIAGSTTNSATVVASVYKAPINSDGTLGTWTTGTSLPAGFCATSGVIINNKIYTFGGWTGSTPISTVYTATISGGLNDYSAYYDGTIVAAEKEDTSNYFNLPDYSSFDTFNIYHFIKY